MNKINKKKKINNVECLGDVLDRPDRIEVIKKESKDNADNDLGQGRTVIVRGQKGEILISSTNKIDTLDIMARIAMDEYNKREVPNYIT